MLFNKLNALKKKLIIIKTKLCYTANYNKNYELENIVLFESYHGNQIASNEFYLLKDLYFRNKKNIILYVGATKSSILSIRERLDYYGLLNVRIVILHSDKYCTLLCKAKYLVNSTSFPDYFVKREGQLYLNTWHGTPLKNMGRRDIDAPHMIANIQRNFLMSDFLLVPNKHTQNVMERDYMLSNLYQGSYILEGYPRNDIFFNPDSTIREELNLQNKKIIVYMPTWRGKLGQNDKINSLEHIRLLLQKLSNSLSNDDVLYVNFHYLMSSAIDFSNYPHIRMMPNHIEPYDFLNIADVLITDYSSVMFDFANSNKKIVLYQFDYQEYETLRGLSIDKEMIPFFASHYVDDIVSCALSDELLAEPYDLFGLSDWESENSSKKINDLFFFDRKNAVTLSKLKKNNKRNILIYTGNLAKNGITTSLLNLLKELENSDLNIYLTFIEKYAEKNKYVISELDSSISYIPIRGILNYTYIEAFLLFLFYLFPFKVKFVTQRIKAIYKRGFHRCYPTCYFDHIIHFSGYDRHVIHLFSSMDIDKTIYCHSDMWQEYKIRKNCHKPTMDIAYTCFNNIALVNRTLVNCFGKFEVNRNNFHIVENVHSNEKVIAKSTCSIIFNAETESTIPLDKLENLLKDQSKVKFITIGRFSTEKGHDRLIHAFERIYTKNKQCHLIIIGGLGNQYQKTLAQAKASLASENIVIIYSIRNPFPILRSCDLFLLSSYYEGLGLVMLEAISLGIPVISTDIPAPKVFLEKGYGEVVENSEDGLYYGMCNFLSGEVKNSTMDWTEYNKNALLQFYSLLDTKNKMKSGDFHY